MTTPMLAAALRLYPASYRAERGAEIAAVYADATSGAGRLAAARETAGIAGYGLRLRTGLTSASPAGHLLATAAPMVLAVGAAMALLDLAALTAAGPSVVMGRGSGFVPALVADAAQIAAAVAVLAGRWAVARLMVVPVLLGAAGSGLQLYAWLTAPSVGPFGSVVVQVVAQVLPPLIWAVLVLGAPPDLLGRVRPRRAALGGAVAFAALLLDHAFNNFAMGPATPVVVLLLSVAPAVLGLAVMARGRRLPAAVVVALLPVTAAEDLWGLFVVLGAARAFAVALVGAAVLGAATALVFRRSRSVERPPAAR
ncbi:hypothetical protein [Kitasatospora sp. KL5]|uniref:hypothetical protein n=1 Tax=Kitasatospora sp. KL5 TaxID=3425125 RepID=UPI003D6FD258